MNRIVVFLAVLIGLATSSQAQTSQIATLLHKGEVNFFYGSQALNKAVEAADSGDVITLSPGQFDAVTSGKNGVLKNGLTIRGAGMGLPCGEVSNIPSEIVGNQNLENYAVNFENVVFKNEVSLTRSKTPLNFYKCTLNSLNVTGTGSSFTSDVTLVNSYVINKISRGTTSGWLKLTAVNSVIGDVESGPESSFQNCILNNISQAAGSQQFVNCVLGNVPGSVENLSFNYCVVLGTTVNPFESQDGLINTNSAFNGTPYVEGSFYELSDGLKALPSSDDTQIGIYGGNIGFSPMPSNPRITKFNVAPKTSPDGKLSIDIEVAGVE